MINYWTKEFDVRKTVTVVCLDSSKVLNCTSFLKQLGYFRQEAVVVRPCDAKKAI